MGRWRSWLSYLSNVHQLGKKVLSSNLGRLIFSIPNSGHNHDHQAEMHSRSLTSLGLISMERNTAVTWNPAPRTLPPRVDGVVGYRFCLT